MPYLLLIIAALVGIYGLTRFIMNASLRQIGAMFMAVAAMGVGGALFVLSITGRLASAIGILTMLWPIIYGLWLRRRNVRKAFDEAFPPAENGFAKGPHARSEALDILGLNEPFDEDSVRAAHRRLITKLHPDQDGTTGLAARINWARDILLGKP